jgi:protein-disulfide isomerase
MLFSSGMEDELKVETKNEKDKFGVPQAIVVAGFIIGAAILLSNWKISPRKSAPVPRESPNKADLLESLRPVTASDHIRGNPNAPVIIVEFSDLECPFCKRFHSTLKRIMSEYGQDGRVAWVYRHFPLDQLHPKARKEAEAAECAAELGGNDAFWSYIDKIFEITPANNGLDLKLLPQIAQEIGLSRSAFEECLSSGRHAARVNEDVNEALKIGAQGTPFSIIISEGQKLPVFGALPYEQLRPIIENLL